MSKKKLIIIISTYACVLVAVLGAVAYLRGRSLAQYRLAARYSAQEALEETVAAADHMSNTLQKSTYATDGGMCARLCSQVYADALAAEAAMSTLPFATQELEEISAYLNQVGDYAYTLCGTVGEEGFARQERDKLTQLATLAATLADELRTLQTQYHNGAVKMDTSEINVQNIGVDNTTTRVSTELLRYEAEFPRRASLEYDGRYSTEASTLRATAEKGLSDAEKLAVAAGFVGVSPAEVRLAYAYEGTSGLKCYSAGDALVVVGNGGVVSMGRSRLVSEENISEQQAQKMAQDFLKKRGYDNMTLTDSEKENGMVRFKFASTQEDALYIDNCITLSVALDDGAVCAFNAESYSAEEVALAWEITEQEAAATAPQNVQVQEVGRVIVRTAGGKPVACYELKCTDTADRNVLIYVDAASGKQTEISL